MGRILALLVLLSTTAYGQFTGDSTEYSREHSMIGNTATWHEIDSVFKPIRIIVKSGDTITAYVRRDMQMRLVDSVSGKRTARDSVFEFVDTLCIKWMVRYPTDADDHVRLYAVDTCASCSPVLRNEDYLPFPLCDRSFRLISVSPQMRNPRWAYDPYTGDTTDIVFAMDTIQTPFTFTIYTWRDPYNGTRDTSIFMDANTPSGTTSNMKGYPIGMPFIIRSFAWTHTNPATTAGQGGLALINLPQSIPRGSMLYVNWVRHPSTRNVGNNKTKVSFWYDDIANGSRSWGSATWLGEIEIDDDGLISLDNTQLTFTVTVWLLVQPY